MKPAKKPLLRGHVHQEAFFLALGACVLLIAKSTTQMTLLASGIYSLGLLLLFGTSALYHRIHWQPKPRALMKRLDHSAIFLLIAGSCTPICLLSLPAQEGKQLLITVWVAAGLGILQSVFWVQAPKWLTALFYLIVGWLVIPYLGDIRLALGSVNLWLLAGGGVAYSVGALFYAFRWPKLKPTVFGYHEVFHVLTVIGAAIHFWVIYQVIY